MGRWSAGLLTVMVLLPPALAAQQRELPALGVRVRAVAPLRPGLEARRLTGTLIELGEGRLSLADDHDGLVTLPLTSLLSLEVSRGRHARTGRGALIGFVTGGVAGAVTLAAVCKDCTGDVGPFLIAVGGAGGAAVGAGLGALVGALVRTERWRTVPVERLRISILPPGPGGAAVGIRVALP